MSLSNINILLTWVIRLMQYDEYSESLDRLKRHETAMNGMIQIKRIISIETLLFTAFTFISFNIKVIWIENAEMKWSIREKLMENSSDGIMEQKISPNLDEVNWKFQIKRKEIRKNVWRWIICKLIFGLFQKLKITWKNF